MKKVIDEKMKKEKDAPPQMPGSIDELFDLMEKKNKENEEIKARIMSGDDLLDQAFNLALKKEFDKK